MDKKQLGGMAAACGANIIFGFSFLFSKVALLYAEPLIILCVRFGAALAAMSLLWAFGVIRLHFRGKKLLPLLLMGIAQPLVYFLFELYGLRYTSSALSGVIIALVPVVVMLFSLFTSERPTLFQLIAGAVSLAGVALISWFSNDGNPSTLLGILLLFGAVLSAAVFNLLSRSLAGSFSAVERTYAMFAVGTVGFFIITLCVYGLHGFSLAAAALAQPRFDGALFYLAICSSVGAYLLYNISTSLIDPVRAASFSNVITVVSVLAGVLILREAFSLKQFLCCVLILAGVYGVNNAPRKKAA